MDVLAPLTPLGWSALLPAVPAPPPERAFEGFQYLGAGAMALLAAGGACAAGLARRDRIVRWLPLAACAAALAIYALGPVVRIRNVAVLDYMSPWLERVSVFRVTGRFFWPLTCTLLAVAIGSVLRRLPAAAATAVLAGAVALQLVDLRPGHRDMRAFARSRPFESWDAAPSSPLRAAVLPRYDHLVMFLPGQCGETAAPFETMAYLAGLHGLTFNGGEQARWSVSGDARYCEGLLARIARGEVDDREIYVVVPAYLPLLKAGAPALVCGQIDRLDVCVTSRSYQAWRDQASFR